MIAFLEDSAGCFCSKEVGSATCDLCSPNLPVMIPVKSLRSKRRKAARKSKLSDEEQAILLNMLLAWRNSLNRNFVVVQLPDDLLKELSVRPDSIASYETRILPDDYASLVELLSQGETIQSQPARGGDFDDDDDQFDDEFDDFEVSFDEVEDNLVAETYDYEATDEDYVPDASESDFSYYDEI